MKTLIALPMLVSFLVAGCGKVEQPEAIDDVSIRTFNIHEVTPHWKPGDKLLVKSAIHQQDIMLTEYKKDVRIFVQPSVAAETVMLYVNDGKGTTSGAHKFEFKDLSGVINVVADLKTEKGVVIYHDGKELLTYEIGPNKELKATR